MTRAMTPLTLAMATILAPLLARISALTNAWMIVIDKSGVARALMRVITALPISPKEETVGPAAKPSATPKSIPTMIWR